MKSKRVTLGKGIGVGVRRIVTIGDCVGVILPKEFLVTHGLQAGDEVGLVWNGHLQVIPGMARMKENYGKQGG